MAFKQGNYTILASYQYYGNNNLIHIYVAIESSPGRFKVYVKKEEFTHHYFTIYDVSDACSYGGKVGEETAKRCFPLIAETYKFEG